jgi:hypothetical protein
MVMSLNLNTLEASFLDEDEKSRYRQEWQQFALGVAGAIVDSSDEQQ